MMAQHHYSFPVVTGIEPTDPLPMRRTKMAVYGRLLAELDANNQQLSQQISEIDLTDPQDARVLMPEQGMTSWATSVTTGFWSATSVTRRTLPSGARNIPSSRRSICVTTARWFWR